MPKDKLILYGSLAFLGFVAWKIWNRQGTVMVEAGGNGILPDSTALAMKKEELAARGFM